MSLGGLFWDGLRVMFFITGFAVWISAIGLGIFNLLIAPRLKNQHKPTQSKEALKGFDFHSRKATNG